MKMMQNMTHFNFGDVILVGFPFTNLQTTKKRPAVIISSKKYNDERPDIILMAITSQIHQQILSTEEYIEDWKDAGLLKESLFKPLIATIEKERIIKTLGHLSNTDKKNIEKILHTIIGNE